MINEYYDFPFRTEKECDDFHDYFHSSGNEFTLINSGMTETVSCKEFEILNSEETKELDKGKLDESSIRVGHPVLEAKTYLVNHELTGIYYTGEEEFTVLVRFKNEPASVLLKCETKVVNAESIHYNMLTGRDLNKDNKVIDIIGEVAFDRCKNVLDEIEEADPGINQFLIKGERPAY